MKTKISAKKLSQLGTKQHAKCFNRASVHCPVIYPTKPAYFVFSPPSVLTCTVCYGGPHLQLLKKKKNNFSRTLYFVKCMLYRLTFVAESCFLMRWICDINMSQL